MREIKSLSIPEQVVLYNKFKPSDGVAKTLFQIDDSTLHIIKELSAEKFSPSTVSINPKLYKKRFEDATKNYQPPRTATRQRRPRGRPGLDIFKAFASIPLNKENSVDAVKFAKEHGIAVSSLRQFNRFDKTRMNGDVKVRKDKETQNLMIWRDVDE